MGLQGFDEDQEGEKGQSNTVFDEFDCPICNANNPYGDGFREKDEIRCYYCGTEFKVLVDGNGRLKLREQ